MKTNQTQPDYGEGLISALEGFAWANFLLAVGFALYLWMMIGTTDARFGKEINPVGIALGFAFLAEGVVGLVFLLTVCKIAEHVVALRKATAPKPIVEAPAFKHEDWVAARNASDNPKKT